VESKNIVRTSLTAILKHVVLTSYYVCYIFFSDLKARVLFVPDLARDPDRVLIPNHDLAPDLVLALSRRPFQKPPQSR
jgi:hypothetical protein